MLHPGSPCAHFLLYFGERSDYITILLYSKLLRFGTKHKLCVPESMIRQIGILCARAIRENPPSPLFKGENSGSVLLQPAPKSIGDMTDFVLWLPPRYAGAHSLAPP